MSPLSPDDLKPVPAADALQWLTAAELREHTPIEPEWTWHGLIARGSVTLLSGKPKSGKSTVILAAIEAIAVGAPSFLGHQITPTNVVYVSEETSGTLAHKLPVPGQNVHILSREHAYPKPTWPVLVAAAVQRAVDYDCGLIVLDTLAYWAAMAAETEKDAGAAGAVMAPILEAARTGIAFAVPVHQRKGGGEDGEGVRGSSAFAGAVDIIVELDRVTNPTQRSLQVLSRYPSSPGTLVVSRDPATGAWLVVGESADRGDARDLSNRQTILDALRSGPWQGLTRDDLEAALGAPEMRFHGQLEELRREGIVVRDGAGRRGNPYLFRLLPTDTAQAGGQKRAETGLEGAQTVSAQDAGQNGHKPGHGRSGHSAPPVGGEQNPNETGAETPELPPGSIPPAADSALTNTALDPAYQAELEALAARTNACRSDEEWELLETLYADLAARYPDQRPPA